MAKIGQNEKPLKPTLPEHNPAGIGLRHPHYQDILETRPPVGWLEIHPENYFGGGAHRHFLSRIREFYPLSFHAVGLSLGSYERVNRAHLAQIKDLMDIYEPFQISDHASWSMSGNAHLNDLLPLPYTEDSLAVLCRNILETQDYLGRAILIENPSTYIVFAENSLTEWDFLNEASARTGCGILLDVNNIYVQAHNHALDPHRYLSHIARDRVKEIHLAGHTERALSAFAPEERSSILIDTHDAPVRDSVWDLYDFAISRLGCVPTLIEWDQNFPPLQTLVDQAVQVIHVMRTQGVLS